jgi:hypothetical protein
MIEKYNEISGKPPYALRKYLSEENFKNEKRYWVMDGSIYHSSGKIPDIVKEAKLRLDIFNGIFYTIDATPDIVVEINPGESSDRKTDNTEEDFVSWVKNAFAV